MFEPGPPGSDFHAELYRLKTQAPSIFWTRYTGGHWYVTETALVKQLLADPSRFSNRRTTLPAGNGVADAGFIPVSLDPPEHAAYRRPLSRAFSRPYLLALEPQIRALAIDIIAELQPRGQCEFIADFAAKLPVVTFLRLFDLPLQDRPWLLDEVGELTRPGSDKAAQLGKLSVYLAKFVAARRVDPGPDLISRLGQEEIDGVRMPEHKLLNMCILLLIGGLDSVTNTLGFIARFLAEHPAHRRQIRDAPEIMNAAVEELLRRFPTTAVGTGRLCVQDTDLGPARIKVGDMLMTSTSMLNFDAESFPDPLAVDFARPRKPIGTFGEGAHQCVGGGLSRLEVAIFIKEWLDRIPEFELADPHVEFVAGTNISYDRLKLRWAAA